MMKRRNIALLAMPLMLSLCAGNMHASRGNHDGFIAGACAVGAALIGAAGAVALVDWCCSETDDQLISRVSSQYYTIFGQYKPTMDYFGPHAGVGIHAPYRPVRYIPETVLYEFGTFLWNNNSSPQDYTSGVVIAKDTMQSCIKDLSKRIHSLEGRYSSYEDQKRLSTMRNVLKDMQQLLADLTLFADCLTCHKSYLHLYYSVANIHGKYMQEINILTSDERYTSEAWLLKSYILNAHNGKYPFKKFIEDIEYDISRLNSAISSLAYNYESARRDGMVLFDRLINIKNIIVSDPRYQQELYAYEQARLERQRIEMMEEQARLERERIRALERQNRILAEQNRLERERMYARPVYIAPFEEVSVTVTF